MARSQIRSNPFYLALVVVGVLFSITAFAYCVMAFRAVSPSAAAKASESGAGLMQLLDEYGLWIMLAQIALLALCTFAAIGTDNYWTRRSPLFETDSL